MSFARLIARALPSKENARNKRWIYVSYDQLTTERGLLAAAKPKDTVVLFVESAHKAHRRPYHKKKLALLLSNERHFALEVAALGFSVVYAMGEAPFVEQLRAVCRSYEVSSIEMMQPAERELRVELQEEPAIRFVENDLWLTNADDFVQGCGTAPPWRMDQFYRHARQRTRCLMDSRGKPLGGRYSFDGENRQPWRGTPAAPRAPSFAPDAITQEVLTLVEQRFAKHWGTLDGFALPCTRDDARTLASHARAKCFAQFGPYEDAMSERESVLFHTQFSSLLNLGRLTPHYVLEQALEAFAKNEAPLQSVEGLVRQVLGWREFVRHVHQHTDGFRSIFPDGNPSMLAAHEALPKAFYTAKPTGLHCLDHVLQNVWSNGYSHHIERLMVLSNIATLLGVEPRALNDWFWIAYTDAYDWVVEPNVLAMGTFGVGPVMTTKPYVAGAGYVHRMSDYCASCRFDPAGTRAERACPLTPMYWSFLDRNLERLSKIERVGPVLATVRKRTPLQKERDAAVLSAVRRYLAAEKEVPSNVVTAAFTPPKCQE